MTGKITRILLDKGFGFITDDTGVEHFFHRSAVKGTFDLMREGQSVTFEPGPANPKGPRAENIVPSDE